MTKIEINAGGRAVTIEDDGPVELLAARALKLWHQTRGASRAGAGVGFSSERRWSPVYEAPPVITA